jgi:hypothetical protein
VVPAVFTAGLPRRFQSESGQSGCLPFIFGLTSAKKEISANCHR